MLCSYDLDLKRSIQGNLKEKKKLIDTFSDVKYPFFLPCSERQLREDFGAGAFQLPLGKSIVIACDNKVFKLTVSASIDVRLQEQLYSFITSNTERKTDEFISIPDHADSALQKAHGNFYVTDRLIVKMWFLLRKLFVHHREFISEGTFVHPFDGDNLHLVFAVCTQCVCKREESILCCLSREHPLPMPWQERDLLPTL